MHHFKKSQEFSPQRDPVKMFPQGPALALDVPDFDQLIVNTAISRGVTSKPLYTLGA